MVFLQSHGVGTGTAVRIYKTYGDEAIIKVSENLYRLALDIRGKVSSAFRVHLMQLTSPALVPVPDS